MSDLSHLADFLDPLEPFVLSGDESYRDRQMGNDVLFFCDEFPDLSAIDIIIVGCGEQRGSLGPDTGNLSPDTIRQAFYSLYFWHNGLRLADIGNVKRGAAITDTYSALAMVVKELHAIGKTVIILGGSHDLTLGQYEAYRQRKKLIEVACIDALIDLSLESPLRADNFLMELLTGDPNFVKHYHHLAFQSYLVHPEMLETLDKLRFDCYRLGHVREEPEEMEPVLRHVDMLSIDIAALSHAAAPANRLSPNGLQGEEICTFTRMAGMSETLSSLGIFGYRAEQDMYQLTAKQIAHMLWYFLDGRSMDAKESPEQSRNHFNEFHTRFGEVDTLFLQSKKTRRWWMQIPNGQFIACSYRDYLIASNNDTPERWFRAQERF